MTRSKGRTHGRYTGKQKSKAPLTLLSLVGAALIMLAPIFALQKPDPVTETQMGGARL